MQLGMRCCNGVFTVVVGDEVEGNLDGDYAPAQGIFDQVSAVVNIELSH